MNAHAPPLALYVHIPFCESKCPYCDFNVYAGAESLMPAYAAALAREIEQWGAWLGAPLLASVFFGGGTPSYLPPSDLDRLMQAIRGAFRLPEEAEATVEANPGDCSLDRLTAMRRAGFNRVSIGAQSFDDGELRFLGRRHAAKRAAQAVGDARQAGFANVSLDLIFGLPDQRLSVWKSSLDQAVDLRPDHLSAYALTLEPGTPMESAVRLGRTREPDPDLAAEMHLLAQRTLADAGLVQYEISNWARPGRESAHNLAYWRCLPYLGVGPGAHSYLYGGDALGAFGVRFANAKHLRSYMQRVNAWTSEGPIASAALASAGAVDSCEPVNRRDAMAETMMMGLRLNDGVPDSVFRARFGEGVAEAFPVPSAECVDLGLLEWAEGSLRLTEGGRLVGNEAFARFVAA